MKWVSASVLVSVFGFLAGTTADLRAEPIAWSYHTHAVGDNTFSDSSAVVFSGRRFDAEGNRYFGAGSRWDEEAGITLFNVFTETHVSGPATILLNSLSGFYSMQSPTILLNFEEANYDIDLEVTDLASNTRGHFSFGGSFGGDISPTSLNLTNTFGWATQSLVLGGNEYSVMIGPFVSPDYPDGADGSISARVEVTPLAADTPEPSTLALAGLGLAGLALARWRRHSTRPASSPGV